MDSTPAPAKSLRFKFLLFAVLSSLVPSLVIGLAPLNLQVKLLLIILIPLIVAALGFIFTQRIFLSVTDLLNGTRVLAKGEVKYRFNIHSGDEIESIAQSLNLLAESLEVNSQKMLQDKSLIYTEKNKLEAVILSIIDGIIVLDLHQNIIIANRSIEKMTGQGIGEMLHQPVDTIISVKGSDGQVIPSKSYIQTTNPIMVTIQTKHNPGIKAKLTVAPIAEGIQTDMGSILIIHDVTQEKLLEQMQIDFVSMASHEFRTPITSIISYLSVLTEEVKDKLDDEHRGFLDRAFSSAQQLSALVDNLLNVAKIERGSFSVSLQPIDWQKRLTEIVENNRPQAVHKNISLNPNLPSEQLPKVLADNLRINEVLNNLISNAINYTKEGGKIEVAAKLVGGEVLTSVSDNGVGIPKNIIPYLFTKFFRAEGALQRGDKGSGLGLYISKSIIDMHHGKIWVDSEAGKGSTFYFTLPLAPASAMPTIAQMHSNFSPAPVDS